MVAEDTAEEFNNRLIIPVVEGAENVLKTIMTEADSLHKKTLKTIKHGVKNTIRVRTGMEDAVETLYAIIGSVGGVLVPNFPTWEYLGLKSIVNAPYRKLMFTAVKRGNLSLLKKTYQLFKFTEKIVKRDEADTRAALKKPDLHGKTLLDYASERGDSGVENYLRSVLALGCSR